MAKFLVVVLLSVFGARANFLLFLGGKTAQREKF